MTFVPDTKLTAALLNAAFANLESNTIKVDGVSGGGTNYVLVQPTIPSSGTDGSNINSIRVATHTDGTAGNIVSNVRAYTQLHDGPVNGEWATTVEMDDYRTTTTGAAGVALYAQGNKRVKGNVITAVIEGSDYSGLPASTGGSNVSLEIDNGSGGADDVPGFPQRSFISMVGAQIGSSPGEIGAAVRIGFRPGQGSIQTVLRLENSTPVTKAVLDLTGAVLTSTAPVIKTNNGAILWDRNGDGVHTVSTSGSAIHFATSGSDYLQILDNGTVNTTAFTGQRATMTPGSGVIPFQLAASSTTVGFDTSLATLSVAAFRMAAGQKLAMDAGGVASMRYDSTAGAIKLAISGTDQVAIGSGTLSLAGTTITGFGTGIGQALGPLINYQGSGFPGLSLSSRLIIDRATAAATDFANLQVNRNTSFTGGTLSNINSALRVSATIGAGDATQNWVTTSNGTTFGTAGGLLVGSFNQGVRGAGGTDGVWGSISDVADLNNTTSLLSGQQVIGIEVDVEANAADNGNNGGSFGGTGIRKGINVVAVRKNSANTTQTEVSHGLWFSTTTSTAPNATDAHTNYQSAIGFGINSQIRNALDTRGAITPAGSSNPVSAVTMSAGHVIDFNGGTAFTSAPGNYLWYDTTASRLKYNVGASTVFAIDNSGNLFPSPANNNLSLTAYGADPTGAVACDAAFASFVTAVMTTGQPGYIPPGRYKFASAATMDFGQASAFGGAAKFYGVLNRSILDFTAVTTASPALQITDSVGGQAAFYGVFQDISIQANTPHAAMAIGLPSHADAFNGFEIKCQISNASTSAAAIGLQVNGCYNCKIWVTANNGGHGDAIQCTEMAFCEMFGAGGHCDNAVHLTSYYNFGNVFNSMDLEVCGVCVSIDSANASRNTWIGGQFAWTGVAAITATAGSLNRFTGMNFATAGAICSGSVGVVTTGYGYGTETYGALYVAPVAALDATLNLDAIAGQSSNLVLRTGGVTRWTYGKNNSTESGSNVGSDWLLTRYSDAGAGIDNPVVVSRSTGITTMTNAVVAGASGKLAFYGASPAVKPTITGSKGANAALTSLLSTLATMGLITDSST